MPPLLLSVLAGALAITSALAFPYSPEMFNDIEERQSCYSSFWNAGGGTVNYNQGSGCSYSVNWNNCNNFVAGKGWNPGSAQNITYSGSFSTSGNAYLSVYGWTTNPLVEYYIMDSYGDYSPGQQASHVGTVDSDGGTYDIYTDTRNNAPSILGTSTFNQYFSIRQTHRVGGTINTANHFNAWKSHNLNMGSYNYQILATEGYQSTGSSSITITT